MATFFFYFRLSGESTCVKYDLNSLHGHFCRTNFLIFALKELSVSGLFISRDKIFQMFGS